MRAVFRSRSLCQRLIFQLLLILTALSTIYFFSLPYDHERRVAILWNWHHLTASSPETLDGWLTRTPAPKWTNWNDDVGVILKSGYGTQQRMPAWLEATSIPDSEIVLIADFATRPGEQILHGDRKLPVHDVVGRMMVEGALTSKEMGHGRFGKYLNLTATIKAGDVEQAQILVKNFGWELDAMKFISGLELAYKKMPHKSWYLMLDDDTYIVKPSLGLLLDRLDPEDMHYIGNAVGGFYGRFGHGGSGVVISRGAMRHLFSLPNADIILAAKRESVIEPYGDRMLALAFLRTGIVIDERFPRYFNGERPETTKIRADRFCAPLFSFHQHAQPEQMLATGKMFRDAGHPVRWFDLWDMCHAPPLDSWARRPMREDWDHIGRLDEFTLTVKDVVAAEVCRKICLRRSKECLAWTWVKEKEECNMSPWMIVGAASSGRISGINAARAKKLAADCR